MEQFELVREPRGWVLDRLIGAALEVCDRFTVERSDMSLTPRAESVLGALRPFLIGCADVSETPGSILLPPDTITLCTYWLRPGSAAILQEASDRLYGWVEPDLPQDLCFLRGAEPWMINLAADDAAYLMITRDEAAALLAAIPGLALREVSSRDMWRH